MSNPSQLLKFSRSEWPVFVPRVADVADELRAAIAAREWAGATELSVRLGAVADGVVGMARSIAESDYRPDPDAFESFDALFDDPLLGLRIPTDRWAEVVNGYAFMRLAVGWSTPLDLIGAALCGSDVEWPALEAELATPGVHPEMRDVVNLFGTNAWGQVETHTMPSPPDLTAIVVSSLSVDARSVLATLGALRRRSVVELRMAAHTMKLSEDRLVRALNELQDADLAEFPASFETLANELTGADLKAIAAAVGAKRTGKKSELVRRLIDEGHAQPLADAINRRGLYHPVALGPPSDDLRAQRAAAGLWIALWEGTSWYAHEDDGFGLDFEEGSSADLGPTSDASPATSEPKGALWAFPLPSGIADHATIGSRLLVFTHQGTLRSLDENGEERWELETGESKADHAPAVLDSRDGLLVITAAAVRLIDPSDGSVAWQWVAPAGPIVQHPAIRNERMYVVTEDGLYAVQIAGEQLWQFNRKRLGAPALGSETIVVTRAGEMLNILDADTGDLLHRASMDGLPRTWAPLVSQDLVFLSGYHNGLWRSVALDARSGEQVWSHDGEYLGDRSTKDRPHAIIDALHAAAEMHLPYGAAEIRRNILQYLRSDDPQHEADDDEGFALGVTTGPDRYRLLARLGETHVVTDHRTIWGIRLHVPGLTPPDESSAPLSALREQWVAHLEGHSPSLTASLPPIGVSDSYVAVAVGLRVVALERTSGALRWSSDIVSTSVHCAGPVCLGIYAANIHAIDASDGVAFWERRLHAEVVQVIHDAQSLFIVTEDGGSTCLEAKSGRIRWSHKGSYRNPIDVYDDEPESDGLEAIDLGWAARVVDGRFQWRSPDGVIRAADAASGADAAVLSEAHLISGGWNDEWLDTEHSEWWRQRTFQDGAVRLLTTGSAWDAEHRGALVIRGSSDELLHRLQPGWQYDCASVVADGAGVAVLAERQRDWVEDEDADDIDDPDEGRQWLLSIRIDEDAGVVVEHGGQGGSDVTYDDLAVENMPRDLSAHHTRVDTLDDEATEPNLAVWLFEGDTA